MLQGEDRHEASKMLQAFWQQQQTFHVLGRSNHCDITLDSGHSTPKVLLMALNMYYHKHPLNSTVHFCTVQKMSLCACVQVLHQQKGEVGGVIHRVLYTWWLLGLAINKPWLALSGPIPALATWTGVEKSTLTLDSEQVFANWECWLLFVNEWA